MAASKITGGCWPVIKILPPFTTHSNPPTIAASPPKRIRAEVAVTPLSYAFPYEHMILPAQSRRTSLRLIHRSAWKGYSPKFMRQNTYSILALHLASMGHDGRLSPLREAGWKGEDTYVRRSEQGPSVSFLGAREPVRPGPPRGGVRC